MKIALLLIFIATSQAFAQGNKCLLAIFAHADDEKIIAPVLAKYAAEGVKVYIAVATDGRFGVTEHAGIPSGERLASVRADEMKCAAKQLGANPPIFMGLPDQLHSQEGKTGADLAIIRERVIRLFTELKPDVVVTWGASGWTGHPDHRLVGDVVTDAFSSRLWGKPARLYYPEIPTGYLSKEDMRYATVDAAYLTVNIALSDADLAKAKAALYCHKSQYTPDEVENTQRRIWKTPNAVAFFRSFVPTAAIQYSLFE
jgi:LmbE family N-acetylglucosaminyl deacetylase